MRGGGRALTSPSVYQVYFSQQMAFGARERAAKARDEVAVAQGVLARTRAASQELLEGPIYPFDHFPSELTIERG